MKLGESKLGRAVFARLTEGADLLEAITSQAKQSGINAGFFILIGTLKQAKLGFYHQGRYEAIHVDGPLEVVSCMGNISVKGQEILVHAHISVANDKGEVFGGHLLPDCTVSLTGELTLVETPDIRLRRKFDEMIGLHLLASDE